MQVHGCTLLDVAGACGVEPVTSSVGTMARPDDECPATESSENCDGFAGIASASATELPVASGRLTGSHKCIPVRDCGDRWFLTSLFLMRLMAAPMVRLRSCKILVWSEAWSAKGEEGKTGYCFKHTPNRVCVPARSTGLKALTRQGGSQAFLHSGQGIDRAGPH